MIDNYYTLSKQADWFAIGPWSAEAPVPVLLAPILILIAAAGVRAREGRLATVASRAQTSTPAPGLPRPGRPCRCPS